MAKQITLNDETLVGRGGLEPPTSRLSGVCSNQAELPTHHLVEPAGVEPAASCLQSTRSTD